MTTTIQAIETQYAGCRFRSRTEARWAVVLDARGLEWEYEPEGFETTCGRYLPDFRVTLWPGKTWWLEVKSTDYSTGDSGSDMGRWICLATESRNTLIVVCGMGVHTIVVGAGGDVYTHAGYPGIFSPEHIAAGKSARFEHGERG